MIDGWQIKKVGEVCDLATGGTPRTTTPAFYGGDIRWLVSGDIHRHEILDCKGRITAAGMKASNAKLLPINSVMIALNGQGKTRGTVAILRTLATCNQSLVCITPRQSAGLLAEFLFANLHGRYEEIRRLTSDADNDRRGLNMSMIREINIPIAPLAEQRRIVDTLDEAFEGIASAKANVEKSLRNARELFASRMQTLFGQNHAWERIQLAELLARGWITGHLDGNHGSDYPRKEEFVDAGVPYIAARAIKGGTVDFEEAKYLTRQRAASVRKGLAKDRDVLFAHNATVGPVAVLSTDEESVILGTSLTYYRCDPRHIRPEYLAHFMLSPAFTSQYAQVMKQSTRNQVPITKQREFFHIIPPIDVQQRIADDLDELAAKTERLSDIGARKLAALNELKQSLLHQAFIGQLTSSKGSGVARQSALQTTTPEFTANIIAFAHARHELHKRDKTFGHVKAQKVLHLVESIAKIDLGRHPMKDAAGPNDFQHMLRAEDWARAHSFFDMVKRGDGYEFKKLGAFDAHMSSARRALTHYLPQLDRVIDLVLPMDTDWAEVFTTVHAAWNNVLIDGAEVTDDAIVRAAREGWHADKLRIPERRFREAIGLIREKHLVPDGTAKYVGGQLSLL